MTSSSVDTLIFIYRSGSFFLFKSEGNPFSPDLQAFVRIFTAPLNVLERLLDEKETLQSYVKNCSWQEGDLKALEFLEKRLKGLCIVKNN